MMECEELVTAFCLSAHTAKEHSKATFRVEG